MPNRKLKDIVGDQRLQFVGPEEKVADTVKLMQEHRVSCVPVISDGALLGIFTSTTLVKEVLDANLNPATTSVREVMAADPVGLDANDHGIDAIRLMREHAIHHVIVRNCGDHGFAVVTVHDFPDKEIVAFEDELEFERRLWEEL